MKTNQRNLIDTSKKLVKVDTSIKLVKVYVSYPPWAESENSWCLLINHNKEKTSWSNSVWFSKKLCKLKRSKQEGVGVLKLPKWLYEIKFKK